MPKTYILRPESDSWAIVEISKTGPKAAKPGERTEKAISWHGDLLQAATSLHDRLAREKCGDASEAKEIVRAARESIAEVSGIVIEALNRHEASQ